MARSARRTVLHITALTCGHTKTFSIQATPNDEIYCTRCAATVKVIAQKVVQWKIACQNCRYARNFGAAPLTARVSATTHAIKRHHVVEVIDSEGWSELVGNLDRAQMILF